MRDTSYIGRLDGDGILHLLVGGLQGMLGRFGRCLLDTEYRGFFKLFNPGLNFVGSARLGSLLIGDFFDAFEPVKCAADGASVVVADAKLLGRGLDRDLFFLHHVQKLLTLDVSDLIVLPHHQCVVSIIL